MYLYLVVCVLIYLFCFLMSLYTSDQGSPPLYTPVPAASIRDLILVL